MHQGNMTPTNQDAKSQRLQEHNIIIVSHSTPQNNKINKSLQIGYTPTHQPTVNNVKSRDPIGSKKIYSYTICNLLT